MLIFMGSIISSKVDLEMDIKFAFLISCPMLFRHIILSQKNVLLYSTVLLSESVVSEEEKL